MNSLTLTPVGDKQIEIALAQRLSAGEVTMRVRMHENLCIKLSFQELQAKLCEEVAQGLLERARFHRGKASPPAAGSVPLP